MTVNTIITVLLFLVIAITFGVAIYIYLKNTSLEEIRSDVYDLFLQAEYKFTETKAGKQKLEWVVSRARLLLPTWAQFIITDKLLYNVIDEWFDMIKDLLDDGKINKSGEGE